MKGLTRVLVIGNPGLKCSRNKKWLGFGDLILNPGRYIVYLTNFDVNTAETILEAHGHIVTV